MKCRVCGNVAGNRAYEVKEMMFGGGASFDYFQCAECGCLQIDDVPPDMASYYAGAYYSHRGAPSGVRGFMESLRDRYSLTGCGLVGRVLNSVFPNQAMQSLKSLRLDPDTRILDVGCGSGVLLNSLRACGMKSLMGADPFADTGAQASVEIRKQSITEVEGVFDLVMFHHSFEHLSNPKETLVAAFRLLADGGRCVIRIPVVPSHAWERYGVNWVQLDAPRHFFLHSPESLHRLAAEAGFELAQTVYDSTAFQFWGSEQYEKGIALLDERSFFVNPSKSDFSMRKIMGFARKANALNVAGKGDQAAFYLVKGRGRFSI